MITRWQCLKATTKTTNNYKYKLHVSNSNLVRETTKKTFVLERDMIFCELISLQITFVVVIK